jgi:hypothetical protein
VARPRARPVDITAGSCRPSARLLVRSRPRPMTTRPGGPPEDAPLRGKFRDPLRCDPWPGLARKWPGHGVTERNAWRSLVRDAGAGCASWPVSTRAARAQRARWKRCGAPSASRGWVGLLETSKGAPQEAVEEENGTKRRDGRKKPGERTWRRESELDVLRTVDKQPAPSTEAQGCPFLAGHLERSRPRCYGMNVHSMGTSGARRGDPLFVPFARLTVQPRFR